MKTLLEIFWKELCTKALIQIILHIYTKKTIMYIVEHYIFHY